MPVVRVLDLRPRRRSTRPPRGGRRTRLPLQTRTADPAPRRRRSAADPSGPGSSATPTRRSVRRRGSRRGQRRRAAACRDQVQAPAAARGIGRGFSRRLDETGGRRTVLQPARRRRERPPRRQGAAAVCRRRRRRVSGPAPRHGTAGERRGRRQRSRQAPRGRGTPTPGGAAGTVRHRRQRIGNIRGVALRVPAQLGADAAAVCYDSPCTLTGTSGTSSALADARHVAIIPARYHSSRLPGKPLADIGGRPMIEHVYRRAAAARRGRRACSWRPTTSACATRSRRSAAAPWMTRRRPPRAAPTASPRSPARSTCDARRQRAGRRAAARAAR